METIRSYDVVGNIAVLNFFRKDKKLKDKKKIAGRLLKKHKRILTVIEKKDKIKGRLRTIKTRHLAGARNLEVLYRENGCVFRFNVETCYFSPRLSEERKKIAGRCKRGEKILVMFSGVAPFGIVIAKNNKKVGKVVCVELGRECNKYANENVRRNKLSADKVEIIGGDVKKVLLGFKKKKIKFNRIVMPRPNLKQSFLSYALGVSKKGTIIHYYGFCFEGDKKKMVDDLVSESKKLRRKIKILHVEKAGDIGPRRYRYRIDVRVVG